MNDDDWFSTGSRLTHRFAIYLPSCEKDGQPISGFDDLASSTTQMLCSLFGGVTSYPAKGLFQRQSGIPQSEEILVLESFCDSEKWDQESRFLWAWARVLSGLLRQESIACSLNGNMSFVPPAQVPGQPAFSDQEAMRCLVIDSMNKKTVD